MPTLFVYGTLQHPPVIGRLLGREPQMRPARLHGFRAAPLDGRVYPGLVPDPDAAATGQVIEVDADEAEVLDRFEGGEYERVTVEVVVMDGGRERVGAWQLVGSSRKLAAPGHWDLGRFVEHDADDFIGGSTSGEPHPGAGPV